MNRLLLFALVTSATVAGTLSALLGQADPPVSLQAATPGVQQIGNASVSGKVLAGSLSATDSGSTAQVIVGNATATSGANYGGLFKTSSTTGTGVRGVATAPTGAANGGTFQSAGPVGAGVRGYATATTGVNYGVYGKATSPDGFGVFSQGNMATTGTISANGFLMAPGAALNRVLTSDAGGNASWQNPTVPLPFTGTTTVNSGSAFRVNNTTTVSSIFARALTGTIAAPDASAIYGENTSSTGDGKGVYGVAAGLGGVGVEGRNPSGTGVGGNGDTGVYGLGWTYGVMGWASYSSTKATYGVFGYNDGPLGVAVYGASSNNATSGIGVQGQAGASSGTTYGGWFQSASASGRGMYGYASAPIGFTYGVLGTSDSVDGRGAYGFASNSAGTTYGVYGRHISPDGFGVYANGRTGASGTKSFRIDHPFDPLNKYLLHYSSESPEPQNFYNGVISTDARGEAWVQLPDYFSEINRDFRYTLTVVDDTDSADFVQVKIAREIRENKFKIRSSAPNVKVSWEVKAIRNDKWVKRYGAPVEQDKQGLERGTYQHPELYGKPIKLDLEKVREDKKPPRRR
jgi:hypothetical protein